MRRVGMLAVLCAVCGLFLSGCTVRVVDFTVISTKNVSVPTKGKGPRAKGEDCVFSCLGLPFGIPNMKEAIDRAIENAGGQYDALVDGVVYQKSHPFEICYEVEGTPIDTKIRGALNDAEKETMLVHSTRHQ